ncbi:MAG: hypothetical protein Q9223_007152 [Gallowayella weberi]
MARKTGEGMAQEERETLEKMLRGMLAFDPTQRSTIHDVLSSDWMQKYGQPAIEALNNNNNSLDKTARAETAIVNTTPEVSSRTPSLSSDTSSSGDNDHESDTHTSFAEEEIPLVGSSVVNKDTEPACPHSINGSSAVNKDTEPACTPLLNGSSAVNKDTEPARTPALNGSSAVDKNTELTHTPATTITLTPVNLPLPATPAPQPHHDPTHTTTEDMEEPPQAAAKSG